MYTNTRSIEAELFSKFKTPTPEVGLQNLRACRLRSGFILFLSYWLTFATDNVNARVPQSVRKMFGFYVMYRYEMQLR